MASPETASPETAPANAGRLASIDALRGFDMFWIIGGGTLACNLTGLVNAEAAKTLAAQLVHPNWNGFTFEDLIFPLFLFLAGVVVPFSLSKRVERGESKLRLYRHIIQRTVLLVLFGMICNGLLQTGFVGLRYPSVLGRIGIAYGFAAIISMHTGVRGRILWILALLFGYWAAMMWIPVPKLGAGNLEPGKTLADFVDRTVLPGKLYCGDRDPEGLCSTIPAIATALIGILAGQWLRESRRDGHAKVAGLIIAAAACLVGGFFWDKCFPINKNLWTSSFVLWTAGWSLTLLSLFYLVIDVWGLKKWAYCFVVIGANALTIYVLCRFVDFGAIGQLVFGHARLHPALLASSGLLVEWIFLWILYRQKIFLRL